MMCPTCERLCDEKEYKALGTLIKTVWACPICHRRYISTRVNLDAVCKPTKAPLSSSERMRRNALIVSRKRAGESAKMLAAEYGLSTAMIYLLLRKDTEC